MYIHTLMERHMFQKAPYAPLLNMAEAVVQLLLKGVAMYIFSCKNLSRENRSIEAVYRVV